VKEIRSSGANKTQLITVRMKTVPRITTTALSLQLAMFAINETLLIAEDRKLCC